MAQAKLTVTRGKNNLKDVTIAAGTPIAGSDAMELNVDYTKITKGDALIMLKKLEEKLITSKWPLI